jgi:hypothetical protein
MNPVFIVGAPRSGTTLLAAMLASHPSFACGPETHFFVKTTAARRRDAVSRYWPDSAVHLLSQIKLEGNSLVDLFGQDSQSLRKELAARTPSEATLLEALTEPFAAQLGKRRWVEKTPNHLLHLGEVLNTFPDAAIVRIVRDPRASAHSMTGLPFASGNFLANCVHWMNWYTHSRDFFLSPGRHITLRYEDLIAHPEAELTRLCAALGERYDRAMLSYQDAARLLQTTPETWKAATVRPLSSAGTQRWRQDVAPDEQHAAALFLKPALDEFGYPEALPASRVLPVFDLTERVADDRLDLLTGAAQSGVRIELLREPPMDARPIFASFDLRARPRGRKPKAFLLRTLIALVRSLARGERPVYLAPIVSRDAHTTKPLRLMVTWIGRAATVDEALRLAIPVPNKQEDRCGHRTGPVAGPGEADGTMSRTSRGERFKRTLPSR